MKDTDRDVETTLLNENFVSEGYFGGGWCDWFEIGGRWSEYLPALLKYNRDFWKELEMRTGIESDMIYKNDKLKEAYDKEKKKMAKELGGDVELMGWKFPNSSQILTPKLCKLLIKDASLKDVPIFIETDYLEEANCDIFGRLLSDHQEDLLNGLYTITPVDYHN